MEAGPGTLVTFEPGERHSVGSEHGAQIILILSPWPGEGHYPEGDPWTILDYRSPDALERRAALEAFDARSDERGEAHG